MSAIATGLKQILLCVGKLVVLYGKQAHNRQRDALKRKGANHGKQVARAAQTRRLQVGVRLLPMPARLVAKLAEWQHARELWGIGDAQTVVCDPCGRAISPNALEHWWGRHRAALGCDGLTLHGLRHSNLSMMARALPSVFDLQRWAGWASLAPAKTYVHTDLDALTAAAGAVLPAPKRAKNAPGVL